MTYTLIDSGNQSKLERFGDFLIARPCSQAVWAPVLDKKAWDQADAHFTREPSNQWKTARPLPASWVVTWEGVKFKISPTDFGHLGIFPEHALLWKWMQGKIRKEAIPNVTENLDLGPSQNPGVGQSQLVRISNTDDIEIVPAAGAFASAQNQVFSHVRYNILNLFAYSGGATLAAAGAGAKVCHVDASKAVVAWARENAALNHLEKAPIRWIVDDVIKFLQREVRRGVKYDGIILDPPSFGRGNKGEVFKIERDLSVILELCRKLLSDRPLFVILSSHTPGYTPLAMQHLMEQMMEGVAGTVESGEMIIPGPLDLPSGTYARWYV